MDPYQKMIKKKKRWQAVRNAFLWLIVLAGIGAGLYGFLFHFGGFRVELTLQGEQEMVLRYGDPFEDPGCDASFSGDYLLQEGRWLPVTTEGSVDESRLGTYEITYHARFGLWKKSVTRRVRVVDRVRPRILLFGSPGTYVLPGEEYQEEGFLAVDNYDGDLTDKVQIICRHNMLIYSVTDSSGNRTEVERKIVHYDPVHPEITLLGGEEITLRAGEKYEEPGYTASDNLEGDLTAQVRISGEVNAYQAGTYILTYTVEDRFGNQASVSRTVRVTGSGQPEIVTPTGKVIYLTFDDGPGPYTRELLDILKKYDVKATFFVVNTRYIELVEDIVDEGHSIGIHSVTHDYDEIYASEEAYFKDLYKMQDIIEEISGVRTTLVRFPGGSSNTVSKFNKGIMTRLTEALTDTGFQYFDWNVNSGDAGLTKETEKVVDYVIEGIKKQKVSIVLQHDIKAYSVAAVEEIIIWALNNGYRFLPLDPTSPNAHHDVRN